MKDDVIGEAGTSPTRVALGRRTERQFVRMVTNSPDHPCQAYFDECELSEGETAPLESWLRRSSQGLWHRGQPFEQTTSLPVRFTDWLETPQNIPESDPNHLHLYTDGSPRESTGYGWALRDSNDGEIDSGSRSLGRYHTAFDGEVATIEAVVKPIWRCNWIFNHVLIHSDSTAAIARVQHNKCGAGKSRAVKVIGHIQRLRRRGLTASIDWIKGHRHNTGNDRADYVTGHAAESQGPSGKHRVSISWMREKIYNSYTTAENIELQSRGKLIIIPPPQKKSALYNARNIGGLAYILNESGIEILQDTGSVAIHVNHVGLPR
jgi:ribonuclease HI